MLFTATITTTIYYGSVYLMAILIAHELGHIALRMKHRVPFSWPLFVQWQYRRGGREER